jgi:peptidoglycan/LPS O-acetylase OafA/YrhL
MATYVCIAIYIAKHTRHFETWRKLGAAGFVIYAMHTLINGMASSGMLFIIGKHNMNNWLTITVYLLTIAISTTICYCAYRLIARSPLLSKLLNGRSTVVTKH